MLINNIEYEFTVGSDVINDGMYIEAFDTSNKDHCLAYVFYSDLTNLITVNTFNNSVPFELIEYLIAYAKTQLIPIQIENGILLVRIDELKKDPKNIVLDSINKLIVNIDCHFTFYCNWNLKIDIPKLCIVDFCNQLFKWIQKGGNDNFTYDSIDDEEQNIFILSPNLNAISVSSCFQIEPIQDVISKTDIITLFTKLIENVTLQLQYKYNINHKDFNLFL